VVKLDFSVPELFVAALQPGLAIEARSTAYPDELFTGRVASVATRLDPISRSITVRALIDNRDDKLRPGMFMSLKLVREEGEALLIPEGAIVPEDSRHFVFVVDDGQVSKRQVEIGRRRPGEVEILQGLTTQNQIVTDGTLNLRDGARVRVEPEVTGAGTGTEALLDALAERSSRDPT
jgi:membrane fusion protein (multidrug efflux system)